MKRNCWLSSRRPTADRSHAAWVQPAQSSRLVEPPTVVEGMFKPVWWRKRAVLAARRVTIQGDEYVQGFNSIGRHWPALAWPSEGLASRNTACGATGGDDATPRMLASLPVRLVPGALPWGTAAVAVGLVADAGLRASWWRWQRSGCFARAVASASVARVCVGGHARIAHAADHFRLYTEMLADNMVRTTAPAASISKPCAPRRIGWATGGERASFARLERGRMHRQWWSASRRIDRMCGRLTRAPSKPA